MMQNVPKLGIVLMGAVIAAWVGVWVPPAVAADAQVVVTGQTTSFADRDDGDIQAGLPYPTPRFKDNGDGTVEDKLTDLIWLKDASCLGAHGWEDTGPVFPALAAVAALNAGTNFSCANYTAGTFADWRLPNVKELQSLIDFGNSFPALPSGHPFAGVQSAFYWSSTTVAVNPGNAWIVLLNDGSTGANGKGGVSLVWPVRGGIIE
jgi:Protein of unknown function (DUF1566)